MLGGGVLGAYRHGSATLGGLRPDSDLDVLVVVRDRVGDRQRRKLTRELLRVSGRDGRRHVELAVVVQADVRPWRYPPRGTGPR
ncbi:nucleotidyltransferase domain-containing protein [Streptomyces sp. NPDC056161]|uniref:nucleotidyltransferase domain-containing protein n=1 Tax=Streptomyces sp. NPDC056161 TaxID=3345732 RepID=UPI0035DF5FD5